MDKNSNAAKVITESLASADYVMRVDHGTQTAERLLADVHQELCKMDPAQQRAVIDGLNVTGNPYGYARTADGSDGTLLGMRYAWRYDPTDPHNTIFVRLDDCGKK